MSPRSDLEKHISSKQREPNTTDEFSATLSASDEEEQFLDSAEKYGDPYPNYTVHRAVRSRRGLCTSIGLNIILGLITAASVYKIWNIESAQAVPYSPAYAAVGDDKVPVLFLSTAEGQSSPYYGPPNDENNKLWDELTSLGQSRLTVEEARPLVNKTLPIPDDPGHYIIQLSVFHALHCLNRIRVNLHDPKPWSNLPDSKRGYHLDHCVDLIRQNLMCCADVTPLPYARLSEDTPAYGISQNVHQCRDFNKVKQWAMDHKLVVPMDIYKKVEGDPLGWGDNVYGF